VLFAVADPARVARRIRIDEAPRLPPKVKLRPCCILGNQAKLRLGPVPLPLFRLSNMVGPERLGRHVYDSGVVRLQRHGRPEPRIDPERNGILYTCRGGFVDTAHLRLAISLAQWTAYQLSIWHEIITWYGWSSLRGWSEQASAFSPEDLCSNLVGIRIAGGVYAMGRVASETLYDASVAAWLASALDLLGAVPREVGEEAIAAVDGLWWDSGARLPRRSPLRGLGARRDRAGPCLCGRSALP
jgi:hypothetical protein